MFRARLHADQVHQVDDDEEHAEHAADHHQAPWHLVRSLILLANRAELGLRKHAQNNQARREAEAYDPIE